MIDIEKWKERNIFEEAIKINDVVVTADQDMLNHIFEHDWLELDCFYNFQVSSIMFNDKKADKKIIHFVGKRKPWQYVSYTPYNKYFWHYLRKSPWKDYQYKDKKIKFLIQKIGIFIIVFIYRNSIKRLLSPKMLVKFRIGVCFMFEQKKEN